MLTGGVQVPPLPPHFTFKNKSSLGYVVDYLIILILNLRNLNMEYRKIRRILNKQRTVGFKLNKFLEFGMK